MEKRWRWGPGAGQGRDWADPESCSAPAPSDCGCPSGEEWPEGGLRFCLCPAQRRALPVGEVLLGRRPSQSERRRLPNPTPGLTLCTAAAKPSEGPPAPPPKPECSGGLPSWMGPSGGCPYRSSPPPEGAVGGPSHLAQSCGVQTVLPSVRGRGEPVGPPVRMHVHGFALSMEKDDSALKNVGTKAEGPFLQRG